jgi:alkylation response protein AidB-like acyl-CoA dehydrogenase
MSQRFANTALQILGMHGPIRAESKWAPLKGVWEAIYQLCPGMNILAGTSEIQRNTIAWIAMGMPRSWDEVFRPKK